MMIESFIEGRVRLRSPIFKDPVIRDRLTAELLKIDGIRDHQFHFNIYILYLQLFGYLNKR
jgi:hypothetical protein